MVTTRVPVAIGTLVALNAIATIAASQTIGNCLTRTVNAAYTGSTWMAQHLCRDGEIAVSAGGFCSQAGQMVGSSTTSGTVDGDVWLWCTRTGPAVWYGVCCQYRSIASLVETGRVRPPVGAAQPPKAPSGPGTSVQRGFNVNGQPYVEEHQADGTVVRYTQSGTQVTSPDGTQRFEPKNYAYAEAPPGTPPELPAEPLAGRVWVARHNEALLGLIGTLVRGDQTELDRFSAAERAAVGDDLFGQILYRTRVARFLATER